MSDMLELVVEFHRIQPVTSRIESSQSNDKLSMSDIGTLLWNRPSSCRAATLLVISVSSALSAANPSA